MSTNVRMFVEVSNEATNIIVAVAAFNIVYSFSSRAGSKGMDQAVISYLREKHQLLIGEKTAETIRQEIGSASPLDELLTIEVRGRAVTEGVPKTVLLTDGEVREAVAESVSALVSAVRIAIAETSPEYLAEIRERGILLRGGGVLKNLDRRLSVETDLAVTMIE